MAAVKRSFDGGKKEITSTSLISPFMPMFENFRNELDEHHDRRERIIKASRDITALSKKIIFSLQRVRQLKASIPPQIAKEITLRQATINDLFLSIAPDLQGINAWRYQRQISGGVQEYMEAVSFQHYLESQRLVTLRDAQEKMPETVALTQDDYVLGLFDLVGELMRFAITSMATDGALPGGAQQLGEEGRGSSSGDGGRDILMDLRSMRSHFEAMEMGGSALGRDAGKKMEVMKTCVEKVENAVYGMIIRGRERPKGWIPDIREDDRSVELVEGY